MRHFTTDGVEEQFSTNKLNFSDWSRAGVAGSQEVGEIIFLMLD